MGHNRAGENRKRRLKRKQREEQRLDRWAKEVLAEWNVKRDCIWAFIGRCPNGPQLLYSATEPCEPLKVALPLPQSMTFPEATSYLEDKGSEVDEFIQGELRKLGSKSTDSSEHLAQTS